MTHILLGEILNKEELGKMAEYCRENWKTILVSGLVTSVLVNWLRSYRRNRQLQARIDRHLEVINKKKSQLASKLQEGECELISGERSRILQLPIEVLLASLRESELSPVSVLEAFQAKALEATEKTNCICDFITEAADWAKALEAVPKEDRGPLYGLPISVKECFEVKDYDQTVGLTKFLGVPAAKDGFLVKRLKELGAVPFCLTNLPQTMKSFGCGNPIFGTTTHPLDASRTPGGSSGGEGALIACGGSVLGVGTDVGGSLRTPASFCGVCGIKPTTGRIFQMGRRQGSSGTVIGVESNAGFMAAEVSGLVTGMRALLQDPEQMSHLDPTVAPLPWNEERFSTKKILKVGWYDCDGVFPSTPGPRRAVHEAVRLLEEAGHQVVPYRPKDLARTYDFYMHHILADRGITTLDYIEGDIIHQDMQIQVLVAKTPLFIRKTLVKFLTGLASPFMAGCMSKGLHLTSQMWVSMKELQMYTAATLEDWNSQEIDIVIGPGFPFPAPLTTTPTKLVAAVPVVGAYNVLNFPAGTVPITHENEDDQAELERSYPRDDLLFRQVIENTRGTVGLPLGVQVIGKPWQEELVLHAMKEIETLARKKNE